MAFSVRYYGYGGHAWMAEAIREPLKLNGIDLLTCHEHDNADVTWTVDGIFDFIAGADAIYLPSRFELEPAKGVNRLAQAWSQKKACVVNPLPSYMKYVKHEHNALVVETPEQAVAAFIRLRDDAVFRQRLADNGFSTSFVAHPHGLANKFVDKLLDLKLPGFEWRPQTFFQIIIPHYQPRTDYISLAIDSALKSWGPDRDILVVSSCKEDPSQALHAKFGDKIRVIYSVERLSFSAANNVGLDNADPRTTHFLLLNDDTLVGEKALGEMAREIGDANILLNPYSNCDMGWLHHDDIQMTGDDGRTIKLVPGMQIETLSPNELEKIRVGGQAVLAASRGRIEMPFCAFYSTLIPKVVVERAGKLNTEYLNGGEDADYCQRARRFGFGSYWTKAAWVFHFGGKSRKVSEENDFDRHHREDRHNNELLRKKWGQGGNKKRIAIWTGPAYEFWDCDSWKTTGIGGSESVEGWLAQTAASLGHYVAMYGTHHRQTQHGVELFPWNEFIPEQNYFDLFIASRNLNCVDQRLRAKNVLAHAHDIFYLSGRDISKYHRERFTKFIALTPWHKHFLSDYHQLPTDRIEIIPNGVSVELFDDMTIEKKLQLVEWGRLHWSSSLDRGLDNAIACLPWILEKCPDIKIHCWYGFANWEASARSRNDTNELHKIEELKKQIDALKDHVVFYGRVNQVELAANWKKAWCLFYPTQFTETHYNTGVECLASFTVPVTSNVAALETTIGDYGIRVMDHPYSREGRQAFIDNLVGLYHNKDLWIEKAIKAHKGVEDRNYRFSAVWKTFWEKYL